MGGRRRGGEETEGGKEGEETLDFSQFDFGQLPKSDWLKSKLAEVELICTKQHTTAQKWKS